MAKKKTRVLDANRTVTVTILARHAFNLAQMAERSRVDHYRNVGENAADSLKAVLSKSADEWGRTVDVLAKAYQDSLGEEAPHA